MGLLSRAASERVAELHHERVVTRELRESLDAGRPRTSSSSHSPGARPPAGEAPWQAVLASAPPLPPNLAGWAESSDEDTEPEEIAVARAEAAFQSALATAQRVVAKLANAVKAEIPPLVVGVARRNTA